MLNEYLKKNVFKCEMLKSDSGFNVLCGKIYSALMSNFYN